MCCVRGPSWSTGRILVQGSMASHSQSTCVAQRSRVRSSSNWRCGSCRCAEEVLVQGLSMLASARQPGGDGGLPKAEDPLGSRRIQPFGQRREHHGDLLGRGFQTIQGSVASSTEGGAARLTRKVWMRSALAMLAIANQRMDVSIGDAEVWTLLVGTGVALGVYAFGCSPAAFHFTPGAYWCRCWSSSRRGVEPRRQAGQSSGLRGLSRRWTVVRLASLVRRKAEEGTSQDAKAAPERRRQTTSRNTNT